MSLYDSFIKTARAATDLDKWAKFAMDNDGQMSVDAQMACAVRADKEYERMLKIAMAQYGGDEAYEITQSVVKYAQENHDTVHPGEKLGADREEALNSLGTAVLVDHVLTEKLASDYDEHTRELQLLGREYCMHLVGCIID